MTQAQSMSTNSLLSRLVLRESNAVTVTKNETLTNKAKNTGIASTVNKYDDEATKVTISEAALQKLDKYNTEMKYRPLYPNGTPDTSKSAAENTVNNDKDTIEAPAHDTPKTDTSIEKGTLSNANIKTLFAKLYSTKIYGNRQFTINQFGQSSPTFLGGKVSRLY